ncbi:precorrin-3B C(17)-methyltransferase [Dehalobacter sp. DCM]|uniref:precorrin-3B C(17)-methyltransferase n=1 Tax=Dehalobacter sp. DCM TaxID=2907827 RepID=UPI003081A72D|nr:precorrin-3B C(17)-methyltransferase [Dehalobacter sp. DCM]
MKIYVVGLGPGGPEQMTNRALEALRESDILVGYTFYIDLIKDQFPGKEIIATPMKREVDRCRTAIEKALAGATVAVVSSGDAGVYGMAGIVLELAEPYPMLEVEVIPGITAACSGAAVLGAPLIHDFAVISLSDLLTPWEKIEARLAAAAQGDFVIVLYNPSSMKRHDYLQRACDIVMRHQSNGVPSGIVRSIGRDGENYELVSSLTELREKKVDMFTTVIIGNSQTRIIHNKLVTPRGYKK